MTQTAISYPAPVAYAPQKQRALKQWLWVLLGSIAIAGFFAIFLAAGRTPGVAALTGVANIFGVSLVVHVDLSVLLWFVGASAATWQLLLPSGDKFWFSQLALRFASACFLGAIFFIALAPWNGGEVVMSNYVPMLTNAVFYLGLALLAVGMVLGALGVAPAIFCKPAQWELPLPWETFRAAVAGSATIAAASVLSLFWLLPQLQRTVIGDEMFFELLYWGPGHILQFATTQTVILLWLLLAAQAGLSEFAAKPLHRRLLWANALLGLGALPVLLILPVDSGGALHFFTEHMRWAGGIAPGIVFLLLLAQIPALWAHRKQASASALLASLGVFVTGGIIGFCITTSNTIIPGHYHAIIGGITLAVMGFVYFLLPRIGYADVAGWKSARIQLALYAVGQLIHAIALAWSGGYGALRKTVESGEMSQGMAFFAKGMIGLGGGLAVIGGVMFVIVCIRAIRRK
jgi:cytochrome c oxidase subunit 1